MFFGTYTATTTSTTSTLPSRQEALEAGKITWHPNWPVVLNSSELDALMSKPIPVAANQWQLTLEAELELPPALAEETPPPAAQSHAQSEATSAAAAEEASSQAPKADPLPAIMNLSYKELLALPQTYQNRRIVSKEGWTQRCEWEGVLFETVVKQLQNHYQCSPQRLTWVLQHNAKGQRQWIETEALINQQALLCLQAQGKPLDSWLGGPVRLLVFDRYWHVGLGQLTELKFSNTGPYALKNTTELYNTEQSEPTFAERGHAPIEPGNYYSFDNRETRAINEPGEARNW